MKLPQKKESPRNIQLPVNPFQINSEEKSKNKSFQDDEVSEKSE